MFHISLNSAITLISRCAFLPQEQPPAPRRYQLLTHGFSPLLLNFLDVIIMIEIYGYRGWMQDRLVHLLMGLQD